MPNCCAVNCNNVQKSGCGRSFHTFPFSQPDAFKQWVVNMRREQWKPNNKSVICSDHFEEKYFDRTGQTVRLRKGAIPTIFQYPPHLQQMPVSEKKTDEAEDMDSTAAMEEHLLATPEIRVAKRNQKLLDEDDAYLQKAMKLIDKSVDEHQVFGDFVASELRNLKSEINRKKLKIMIEKAIIEITELEINELSEAKQFGQD